MRKMLVAIAATLFTMTIGLGVSTTSADAGFGGHKGGSYKGGKGYTPKAPKMQTPKMTNKSWSNSSSSSKSSASSSSSSKSKSSACTGGSCNPTAVSVAKGGEGGKSIVNNNVKVESGAWAAAAGNAVNGLATYAAMSQLQRTSEQPAYFGGMVCHVVDAGEMYCQPGEPSQRPRKKKAAYKQPLQPKDK